MAGADQSITFTFAFSQPVTGFTADDITLSSPLWSKGAFTPNSTGNVYTLVVPKNPNITTSTDLAVSVHANAATDASTGLGSLEAHASQTFVPAPKLTITDNKVGVAGTYDDVTFTFKFSQAVTGFTTDDIHLIQVSGRGSSVIPDTPITQADRKGTFTQVSDTEYTLVVPGHAYNAGSIRVSVDDGAATASDALHQPARGASDQQKYSVAESFSLPNPLADPLSLKALNFINPVTLKNGRTYYYMDFSGNFKAYQLGHDGAPMEDRFDDVVNHDFLDALFNGGNDTVATQLSGAERGVDDARTALIDGYTIVLPTQREIEDVLYPDAVRNPDDAINQIQSPAIRDIPRFPQGNSAFYHVADKPSDNLHQIGRIQGRSATKMNWL